MYGKIFDSMFDGSLYGHWQAIVTMQQMIVLANVDGVVDMTPQAIAARTSIPLDIIQEGIKVLEQPDEYSRSPDQEGRRIERLEERRPWGWRIVNYVKYSKIRRAEDKRAADRERIAAKRLAAKKHVNGDKSQGVALSRTESQSVAKVAHVDVDVDVLKTTGSATPGFVSFWTAWPNHKRKADRKGCLAKWQADGCEQKAQAICAAVLAWSKSEDWTKDGGQYVPAPRVWLNQRRYEAPPPGVPPPLEPFKPIVTDQYFNV